jgi:aerobic carbon-monoxide dehydrogenase medium subunit
MKPPPFVYRDPGTVAEALEALAEYGDEGKVLAGGQSLVPLLNMRLAQPQALIDLNRIAELQYVEERSVDSAVGLAFGAMTRQSAVEDSADPIPLLREAISWVGHPQIRNRGTIGGSIAHADPSAELPLVFRALDGMARVQSQSGERVVPAEEFFLYTFTPNVEPDEIVTEVWLPLPLPRTGQAFLEVARRHGDFALVAAAVSLTLDAAGTIAGASIALGGTAPTPMRAAAAEASLVGATPGDEAFAEAGRLGADETEPTGDIHADADYRRDVAGTLVRRALQTAYERIGVAA